MSQDYRAFNLTKFKAAARRESRKHAWEFPGVFGKTPQQPGRASITSDLETSDLKELPPARHVITVPEPSRPDNDEAMSQDDRTFNLTKFKAAARRESRKHEWEFPGVFGKKPQQPNSASTTSDLEEPQQGRHVTTAPESSRPNNDKEEVCDSPMPYKTPAGEEENTPFRASPNASRVDNHPARPNLRWKSDLILDSKLETKFIGGQTQHVSFQSVASAQQRKVEVKELWARKRKIGKGAYGQVWLESCSKGPTVGSLRAVKIIPKILGNVETNYKRELEAITKFSQAKYVHCFVQSLGWYEDNDFVYIAMEYVDHGDLQERFGRCHPEVEVKSIASQLLEGLHFMHENGFTHRDLKPGNILVLQPSPDWWVKIGDFGISKRVEEGSTCLRTTIGTRGYLAPEVIGYFPVANGPPSKDDHESYTSAVDIWSLGEICFGLLTNQPAFSSSSKLSKYVIWGHEFPLAPLQQVNTSDDCVNFIKQTMSPSAAKRPSASGGLSSPRLKTEGNEDSMSQMSLEDR
ncbi:kinase-like domain-containing protein [Pestalotiopsis sp. NC0098]|nr:kinase-like domain-containing protein [Pestalotiopsis sp. NC0098]